MHQPTGGQAVFSLLHRLQAPQAVVHVGAGNGVGLIHQWHDWPVNHALLIDTETERLSWVGERSAGREWRAVSAVVGADSAPRTFYRASNSDEDGLISPAGLTGLWPNLRCAAEEECTVQPLDVIAARDSGAFLPEPLWLLIDCFPALDILRGAVETVSRSSVVAARVIQSGASAEPAAASLTAVEKFLSGLGFRLVHVESMLNPSVGHAFFVRDWPARIEALTSERDVVQQEIADRGKRIEANEAKLADRDRHLAETQAKLAEQNSRLEEAASTMESLRAERDQARKDRADLKIKVEEAGRRMVELEQQASDNRYNRQQMQEELISAEAQIELIKDLLLREPGL